MCDLPMVVWAAQRYRDAWEALARNWLTDRFQTLRTDPHQLSNPLHLSCLDSDSPLPLRPTLEVVDGHRLSADNEQPLVRHAEPVVERGHGNAQTTASLGWRKQVCLEG